MIKVVILDDNRYDAELANNILDSSEYNYDCIITETKEEYIKALKDHHPDVILADYMMPNLSGMDALTICKDFDPYISFVIFSGHVGEEKTAEIMKAGASDVVLKDKPSRLPYALKHCVEKVALDLSQQKLLTQISDIVNSIPGVVYKYRRTPEGNEFFDFISKGFKEIYNINTEDNSDIAKYIWSRVHPDDIKRIKNSIDESAESLSQFREAYRTILPDETKWSLAHALPQKLENGDIVWYGVSYDITCQKQIENNLDKARRSIEHIFSSITDAVFTVNKNWEFTGFNPTAEQLMDLKRENLIGKNIWETFPFIKNSKIERMYLKAVETGESVHFETYIKDYDSWQLINAYPHSEGLTIYFRDVTEKKKKDEEIQKLSLVASKTHNAVVITNDQQEIEWVNGAFTKLTGYKSEEVMGGFPMEYIAGEQTDTTEMERIRKRTTEGEIVSSEIIGYDKSGDKYWIQLEITPVKDDQGVVTRFFGILTDITQKKQEELVLQKMNVELNEQNKALRQFTNIISHNLRAPVANMLGLVNLIESEDTVKDNKERSLYIEKLKTAANDLNEVTSNLNNILDLRNRKDTSMDSIKLSQIIRESFQSFRPEEVKLIDKLMVDLQADDCVANREYMISILQNLFSNSIKYRDPDRPLQIKVSSRIDQNSLVVDFQDNGLGIDLETHGQDVFKLNKRFHANESGKGFGLYLAKEWVEAMNGAITVDSEENSGTRFTITLPWDGSNPDNVKSNAKSERRYLI